MRSSIESELEKNGTTTTVSWSTALRSGIHDRDLAWPPPYGTRRSPAGQGRAMHCGCIHHPYYSAIDRSIECQSVRMPYIYSIGSGITVPAGCPVWIHGNNLVEQCVQLFFSLISKVIKWVRLKWILNGFFFTMYIHRHILLVFINIAIQSWYVYKQNNTRRIQTNCCKLPNTQVLRRWRRRRRAPSVGPLFGAEETSIQEALTSRNRHLPCKTGSSLKRNIGWRSPSSLFNAEPGVSATLPFKWTHNGPSLIALDWGHTVAGKKLEPCNFFHQYLCYSHWLEISVGDLV
jgi:hypothetical protein